MTDFVIAPTPLWFRRDGGGDSVHVCRGAQRVRLDGCRVLTPAAPARPRTRTRTSAIAGQGTYRSRASRRASGCPCLSCTGSRPGPRSSTRAASCPLRPDRRGRGACRGCTGRHGGHRRHAGG
jgi:hypothetical protein